MTPRSAAAPSPLRRPSRTPVWLPVTAVAVAVVLGVVVWVLPSLLTRQPQVTGAERHKAMADVRTSLIALLGALGAAGGLSYTARTYRLSQVAHLTGRFQDASKQMGEHHPTVRLGGIQAMAQLADEWVAQRQGCVDVLCAFVRASGSGNGADAGYRDDRRRTVELIADRLRPGSITTWIGSDFDFTGAVLDVADFSGVSLAGGRFSFEQAHLAGRVRFDRASFTGADVSFAGARFEPGCEVSFDGAGFDAGAVTFDGADFAGGKVRFAKARFGPGCGVTFARARLGNGGSVSFGGAEFAVSGVSFAAAKFVSSADGGGDVSFANSSIRGPLDFERARFDRVVRFDDADLAEATLRFHAAELVGGRLVFDGARCGGAVLVLDGAACQGGSLDLRNAEGTPEVRGADLGPPLFCDD